MPVTVEGWIEYAALRGDVIQDTVDYRSALVRGSDYIRAYFPAAVGRPEGDEATYIAAALELGEPGFWSVTARASDAKVLTEVGNAIKWTVVDGGSADTLMRKHNRIEELLWLYSRRYILPGIMSV